MLALIQGLPHDAATFRDRPEGWSHRDEIAASQIEVLDLWGRRWLSSQGLKGKLPEAIRVPRPTDTGRRRKRVETDPQKIREWFSTRGRH
jgi:hypothetical protein